MLISVGFPPSRENPGPVPGTEESKPPEKSFFSGGFDSSEFFPQSIGEMLGYLKSLDLWPERIKSAGAARLSKSFAASSLRTLNIHVFARILSSGVSKGNVESAIKVEECKEGSSQPCNRWLQESLLASEGISTRVF
jgi:hypothetical protein